MLPKNEPRVIKPDERIRLYIYGMPYSGKTTFASQFPDPVILSTDGNYDLLDTPAITLKTTKDWIKAIEELEEGKHTFKTVIIDVVDQFFEIVRSDYLRSADKEHETDLNRKGWELVRKPFKLLLYRIAQLPLNLVFIGHSKVIKLTDSFNNEKDVISFALPDDLSRYLSSLVRATMYVSVEKTVETDEEGNRVFIPKHMLYLNTIDDTTSGGSRILFTKDKIELDYNEFMDILKESVENPIRQKTLDKKPQKQLRPLKPLKEAEKPQAKPAEKPVDKTVAKAQKTDVWS